MTTDNKTLAGVQPGGRVRLGDQAELDRLEFQAWARELLPCPFCGNSAEFVPYKDNGLTLKCKSMGCIQRNQRTLRYGIDWLRTSMAEHWNTRALSAQPSPGGQDALPPMPACRDRQPDDMPGYMESALDWVRDVDNCDAVDWLIDNHAAIRAALAARQPVGGEKNPDHLRDLADIIDPERQANTIRKVVDGWSGWATQSPGKMPKLYGAREIAEVNHNPDQGQRLIFLSEQPVNVGALADAARAAIPFVAYAFSQGVIGAEESGRAIESALESIPPVGEAVPAEFGLGQFRYSVKRSKSCLENHMQGDPAVISREISECDRLLDLIDSHSGVSRD
ncbi:Lar family restriction alleviation protein [Stenotrophomonas maltophilia]|uniref:hypothetical protein n=1 Tax=Stenotrophomonas maltophilia TaxID=40324 RepID=UPI002446FD24|nr:hypothetical protein [Stenotrophomonas maltophilia]MDG9939656.1 Lar family restriction alleviation protein [Stenotrophomonas maltophilia]MDH0559525.1 Lar family restriction alleviation protein [Stenotrophomonas maltophilia]